MPTVDVANLSLVLGLLICLPQIYGLLHPAAMGERARRLPRSETAGYGLMAAGTIWFLFVLQHENLADFDAYKTKLQIFFGLVGVGACIYLRDFLAVRGMAVLMLLMAKLVVDNARHADSAWRVLLVAIAYGWIVKGMIFTVSPWRCRDIIEWAFSTERRIRLLCALRLAVGILLVLLGLTVFKTPVVAGQ